MIFSFFSFVIFLWCPYKFIQDKVEKRTVIKISGQEGLLSSPLFLSLTFNPYLLQNFQNPITFTLSRQNLISKALTDSQKIDYNSKNSTTINKTINV